MENLPGLPFDKFSTTSELEVSSQFLNVWNASYMHAMMWRWLPIGDLFVDVFSSRDSDSEIIQREEHSVNAWLNSNKVAHIMRGRKLLK